MRGETAAAGGGGVDGDRDVSDEGLIAEVGEEPAPRGHPLVGLIGVGEIQPDRGAPQHRGQGAGAPVVQQDVTATAAIVDIQRAQRGQHAGQIRGAGVVGEHPGRQPGPAAAARPPEPQPHPEHVGGRAAPDPHHDRGHHDDTHHGERQHRGGCDRRGQQRGQHGQEHDDGGRARQPADAPAAFGSPVPVQPRLPRRRRDPTAAGMLMAGHHPGVVRR